jgi:hypothetical protein
LETTDLCTPDLRDGQSSKETDQSALDELHKRLDNPVMNTASEHYDQHDMIEADLEEMKESGDKTMVCTSFLQGL